MRRLIRALALLAALGLFPFPSSALEPFREPEVLYQFSTLESLLAGYYDGGLTFHELAAHGDIGLGTFDRLDGEMLEVDGTFYQVRADGSVQVVDLDATTPFAQVTPFEPDITVDLGPAATLAELTAQIDAALTGRNQFYAVRVTGRFTHVKTRSVPAQEPPYPPLAEVVKTQSVFELSDVDGVMVGFFSPDFVGSAGVPGYHLHFLATDHSGGGHVLDAAIEGARLELDATPSLRLTVPSTPAFQDRDFAPDQGGGASGVEH